FNLPPPPVTSTLSLHDALPILFIGGVGAGARSDQRLRHVALVEMHRPGERRGAVGLRGVHVGFRLQQRRERFLIAPLDGFEQTKDRKSTRLNSSHVAISYAVFC